jgi:hypothetical protein
MIARVLHGDVAPGDAVGALMERSPAAEFGGR